MTTTTVQPTTFHAPNMPVHAPGGQAVLFLVLLAIVCVGVIVNLFRPKPKRRGRHW